ncbi:AMP-dependent synthetase and ligase [Rubrobacter xylanophilus DSM 9941]|uniref:AMP-dependent synthetase and ligase n=1 Tax=Rubrobacter xylanophilus (strain DSM 9941 / JCM 11954 / NBRC 16129 / PRD-1) TaxID=266117 RepID=Q1AUC3_RUBXD|nr:long-chain fatty acid--CoA ligase [Rubrobacter xylanophilus]ABG05005.1 AMP-dependent synthetase and ligase [Rubrobacter xylanophilus DSM 9941]
MRPEAEELGGIGNLVEALHRNAVGRGGKGALHRKVGGRWEAVSYGELYGMVRDFAAGLAGLGVGRGDRVGLIARNRVEWAVTDFAVQSLGAATVPVYPTLEPEQMAHILADCEARVVVVEDGELLGRVSSARGELPALEHVVVMEGEGATLFEEVLREGRERPLEGWEEGWRSLGREDVATIIYTSGTTGRPKGAVLTHGNILSNLEGIQDALTVYPEDVFLSFLPLSHVFERTCGQFLALGVGASVYYAESVEKVPENLREVRPTVMPSVPRLYEKMHDRVRAMVAGGSPVKRWLFGRAVAAGRRRYEVLDRGGRPGLPLRAALAVYDRLVFRRLREAVGGRVRFFVSGGAKLDTEVGKFFYAAGIKIMEGYGLTETSPVIACNRLEKPRFGTVGLPLSNLEVRISPEGEIQVRGPSVMRGYFRDERSTEEAFTQDGFFRTGDIGSFDEDGYLTVTDRLKSLIVLSTGKNVAPQPIESALVTAPHISQAVVVGEGRKYVSALVVPDYRAVRATLGVGGTDEELAGDGRVQRLIEREVEEATRGFADYERPKKVALLPRELSQEAGELTPTLKVKTRVVQRRYGGYIERLYA